MVKEIKRIRVNVDGLVSLTEALMPIEIKKVTNYGVDGSAVTWFPSPAFGEKYFFVTSEELKCAAKSLKLGKAWLGKLLGELGEQTPYANDGKRDSVDDIESAVDKAPMLNSEFHSKEIWESYNHIQKVDFLREELKLNIHTVEQVIITTGQSREFAIARTNAYNHLSEARFWLGFELERIKKEHEKK